jgi:hypothetical protein
MKKLDAMYQRAMGLLKPKPDPRKGKSARELAEEWYTTNVGPKVRKFVKEGLMIRDKDWRPHGDGMKRCYVYRWNTAKFKGAKRDV